MNLLKTTFYDEFACIGAECPLTCCGGWKIEMEEKTLKDYRMMGGEIGRFARKGVIYDSDLQSYVVRLRDTDCSDLFLGIVLIIMRYIII